MDTDLTINGNPQNYHILAKVFNPETLWVVDGQVTPEQIQLQTEKALIFKGELSGRIIWKWNEPMAWQLNLDGKHLDLSLIHPDWPHPLDIQLESAGDLANNQPRFSWTANLHTPQTQVSTQGSYTQQWDIKWNITAKQLAELLPFSSGSFVSTGELHGSLTRPKTKGNLAASLLRWQDYRVDKLDLNWDLDITEVAHSFFKLTADQVFTPWAELQKVELSGLGKWEKHELNAHLHGYNTDLVLGLSGGLSADHWEGSIQKLILNAPLAGNWTLTQPSALFVSTQKAESRRCVYKAPIEPKPA